MGIYAVSREVTEYIPDGQYFGFDMLMNSFLEKKIEVAIYEHTGYWMDIGRPDDYVRADRDIEEGIFKY